MATSNRNAFTLTSFLVLFVLAPQATKSAPPEIEITAYRPGTTTPKNTGTVELSWRVTGADELHHEWSRPRPEVLEPGVVGEGSGWGNADDVTPTSNTVTITGRRGTRNLFIEAKNEDGNVFDGETIYYTTQIGYHNARCPAGGTIYTNEIDDVREMLEVIDDRLRSNRLAGLPDYLERTNFIENWNAQEGLPLSERVDERILDMEYLSGMVGTGGLADDMLRKMRNVLIYIHAGTLPRTYSPRTAPADSGVLCEGGILGKTPSTRVWVAICYDEGGDEFTLAHELFHYATKHNNVEMMGYLTSYLLFDYEPGSGGAKRKTSISADDLMVNTLPAGKRKNSMQKNLRTGIP